MSFPASWARIPVTATYLLRDEAGTPATGRVEFRSSQIVVADGSIIVPVRVTATLDSAGRISLVLPATDDPDIQPNSWTWSVTEIIDRQPRRTYALAVPHTAPSIDLSSISPIPPGSPVYDYLLTSAIGVTVAGQGDLDALDGRVTALEEADGAQLSDDTPESLGTASSGVGTEASRSDHVHPMPTAAQVGALAAGDGLSALDSAAATKLAGIAAGAEVNVNADWNASTGDAAILNKPTLGTAAAQNVEAFATAAQGIKADTALQIESDPTVPAWAKQPSRPSYTAADVGADPTGTAASAVTTHESAPDPHPQYLLESAAAAVATSGIYGDLTDRPTLGTAAAQNAEAFATADQGTKADNALPLAGGTIASASDKPLRIQQTGHPAAADVDFAFGVGGGAGYAGFQIIWTKHPTGPGAGEWVRRMRMDPWGVEVEGTIGATAGVGAPVQGQGTMAMVNWINTGSRAGRVVVGHAGAYEGFGVADHWQFFGPEPSSRWQVWSAAQYQSDALKLDLDFAGNFHILGNVTPITDISASLGDASRRWTQVHAQDGTIQTSDARQKTPIAPLSPALLAIGLQCAREIGQYKWLERVAEVGEAARWHIGITVQRVIEIFTAHGEDAYAYGIVCYDEWPERIEVVTPTEHETRETGELDEHGIPVLETIGTTPAVTRTIPAGNAYSLRYDELSRLMTRALIDDHDALAQRVAALEAGA